MDSEATEVTNPAPASETPNTPNQTDASVASSGAATETEAPKDRGDFIRQQVEAKRADEAVKDAKIPRRAPEGQFKRGPGRPSKAELAAREAAKTKPVEKPAETPAQAVAKPAATPAVAETAQPVAQAQGVPMGLRAPFKATFGQLPKEWQDEVARLDKIGREAADQVGAKHAPEVNFAKEIRAEFQPFEMMLRAEGATPQTAIRALMQDAAIFRFGTPQQKASRLQQIAQIYNVPLQAAAAQSGEQPEGALPDISQHPAYQQLAGMVQQLKQSFTQQTQAQTEAQETSNLNAVNAFLAEVDDKGNSKNPLDDSLQTAFAQQIGLVRSANPGWDAPRVLAKAYENLSWTEPTLRTVILQRQEADKQAKTQQELAAKRQAAVSLKPGTPAVAASTSTTQKQSRSEFLKEQLSGLRA